MCIDRASVGSDDPHGSTIHSTARPKSWDSNGLIFRDLSNAQKLAQSANLNGNIEHGPPLREALQLLWGVGESGRCSSRVHSIFAGRNRDGTNGQSSGFLDGRKCSKGPHTG